LLVGLAVFFPLFALGAMGAGDVKLMAAIGAWLGWTSIIYVALYASLAGGVLAIILALRKGYLYTAVRNLKMLASYWWIEGIKPLPALTLESKHSVRLPYALAIAAGVAVTLWQR
jgi:prepilin peptidase CpaA